MKHISYFLLSFLVLALFSCKKEDSLSSNYGNGLKGNIQKGPFINGSSVIIQELDKNLNATGISFNTTTNNDFGGFEIKSKIRSPYIEIITNGFFYNEVKGKISETNITLRSITEVSDSSKTNVNLLTTLSRERIIYLIKNNVLTFKKAKEQAQAEILRIFNIPLNGYIDFNKMDISLGGENNAILLAISVILQGDLSEGILSEKISKFILDIKEDGTLDDLGLNSILLSNAKQLDLISIRNNLIRRYEEIGHNATIPPFEKYAKRLVPLQVTMTSPVSNEEEIPFTLESISIYFNKAINVLTVGHESLVITNSAGYQVSGNLKYDPEQYKIIFTLGEKLLPTEVYTVRVTRDVSGLDGDHLISEFIFYFKTLEVNLNKGLRAYYTFSNSMQDVSGNYLNATSYNATFTEDINGIPGNACRLTGEGSYLELPNVLNITEPNWSYSIWVKLNSFNHPAILLGSRLSGAAFWDIPLYIRSSTKHVASYNGGILDSPKTINQNQWYHIVAVVENSIMTIYVDGEVVIKGTSFTPSNDPGDISYEDYNGTDTGLFNYYTGKYSVSQKSIIDDTPAGLDGSVDNIRFYNRAINKYEVLELYNQKK